MLPARWAVVMTAAVVGGIGVISGLRYPVQGSAVGTVLVVGAVSLVVGLPLFEKLGVNDRTAAVTTAISRGDLPPP